MIRILFKIFIMSSVLLWLTAFTGLTEQVSPPKGVPKRTEDVNAGIVIPAFNCKPYDIIKHSYDRLDAFMLYPEKGIFLGLKTSNFDLTPHKLTFYHKEYGFITNQAYRVNISFDPDTQEMVMLGFSPFEITLPKSESEVRAIADQWVRFFDSLGWIRAREIPEPYIEPIGSMPNDNKCTLYQEWESSGFNQSVSVCKNEFLSKDIKIKKYYIEIVFESNVNREKSDIQDSKL